MKSFILISDFDGTMTEKDFYKIVIDDYIGEEGKQYLKEWRKNHKIDIDFLNKILAWHSFDLMELEELLMKVQLDSGVQNLCHFVENKGGKILVLSAGFDFYIRKILERENLGHLEVISNPGVYENQIFVMRPDDTKDYHSEVFGVDKEKVVLQKRDDFDLIIFIGDSEPDLKAALAADIVFAKGELQGLLAETDKDYYKVNHFDEAVAILNYLL